MAQGLRGCGAVVGSTVTLDELPSSVRVAESGTRLLRAGVLTDDPVFVADHYDTVMVARDPWLLDRLREQALAPLADLPPATRQRLEDTLAAWLAAMGDRQAAARTLQIHPQTVRYRLRQLQDLFGDALTDPASRLRLTLALCWT
jgi:DNA-binding PucR family transcriptional regulator